MADLFDTLSNTSSGFGRSPQNIAVSPHVKKGCEEKKKESDREFHCKKERKEVDS